MRLLYFINQIENSGGIERIVIDKVNYLAQQPNFNMHLVYYGKCGDTPFYPIEKSVKLWAIEEKAGTHSFKRKLLSISHIYREVCKIIDLVKPDIIVNANAVIVSYFLPLIYKKIPKIVELHFTYEGLQIMNDGMYGKNSWKSTVNNFLRRFFYAKYQKCVVLVNDDMKAWGFRNLVVIPNFTNLTFSARSVKREKTVISVGRLEEQKDHKMLIKAWTIVNKKHSDWKLEIWGDGALKDQLHQLIIQERLQNSVYLKGITSHIDDEYVKASIFALSSLYEGMPLVAIEAMTAGVPCVSFDISGIRDVISDGEDGIIVRQHTPEAFAMGIIQLIENEQLLCRFSEKCICSVSKFKKDSIMKEWIKLFETLDIQYHT